jgi:hypothetical protein
MPIERRDTSWNDERLDSLERQLQSHAEAITYNALHLNTVETEMAHLKERQLKHEQRNMQVWLTLAALISNPITAIIVYIVSKGHTH